jgi:perosamine synthetase
MIEHSKPTIGEEEIHAVERALRSGHVGPGAEVEAFEAECAAAVGRKHAVALNSGAAALHLALVALEIDGNDTVAFPAYGPAAMHQAVAWQRARPVQCDIGADYNLEPSQAPWNAAAVILPHLFGCPGRLPPHSCIIEDLAQSMGNGTGRTSQLAVASFHATSLLTTGEGGMLFTDEEGFADLARDLRDYRHRDDFRIRYAYQMSDVQAAMGRVQLSRLPEFVERRRALAARYTEAFRGLPLQLPSSYLEHIYCRYVVATPRREALELHLAQCGVEAKRPMHRPAHHDLGGEYPASERAYAECLSLPLYPTLTSQEIETVVESVLKFFA